MQKGIEVHAAKPLKEVPASGGGRGTVTRCRNPASGMGERGPDILPDEAEPRPRGPRPALRRCRGRLRYRARAWLDASSPGRALRGSLPAAKCCARAPLSFVLGLRSWRSLSLFDPAAGKAWDPRDLRWPEEMSRCALGLVCAVLRSPERLIGPERRGAKGECGRGGIAFAAGITPARWSTIPVGVLRHHRGKGLIGMGRIG